MSLQSAVQHAAATLGSFVTASMLVTDSHTKQIEPMWLVAVISIAAAIGAPLCLAACERALANKAESSSRSSALL
jgi:hypothetical protein